MATGGRRPNESRKGGNVQFADEEGSPSPSPENLREGKDAISHIDKALAEGERVDRYVRQVSSLEEFSKKNSRLIRDNELN